MSLININNIIKEFAVGDPGKKLITIDQKSITYSGFIREVDKVTAALVSRRDWVNKKVGIIIPNSLEWYILFWGIVQAGAVPVPLDPQIGEWEIEKLLSILMIDTCFAATAYRANNILENIRKARLPLLKNIITLDREEEGIMSLTTFLGQAREGGEIPCLKERDLMLACTSGSTGNPKILVVPYQGFCTGQNDMARYLNFSHDETMLLGMPLYHQGGFGMGLQMVISGGSVIYQTTFDPDCFLKTIEEKKVNIIQLTPTLAKILITNPDFRNYDLSSVRMCYFAGEVLPGKLARQFYEELGIRVINIIGSSETGTMLIWDSDHDREVDVSDFRALPFTKFKILDEGMNEVMLNEMGTIYIKTDALIKEYYKNPDENSLRFAGIQGETWFNTGDLGIKLPGERVRFAGRGKRIIKRGSNLIYPEELESFFLTHPDIEAVAVMGEEHELLGEIIVAYVQPRKGTKIKRGDIVKFCKNKMSAYKIPDKVISTEVIPHDIGKIQYKYLRKEVSENDR